MNNNQFNNPMNAMLQAINSGNPMQIVNQRMNNDPKFKEMAGQIQNMMGSSKLSPKDFTIQYLGGMGIDPQQVEMLAKKMGIK